MEKRKIVMVLLLIVLVASIGLAVADYVNEEPKQEIPELTCNQGACQGECGGTCGVKTCGCGR